MRLASCKKEKAKEDWQPLYNERKRSADFSVLFCYVTRNSNEKNEETSAPLFLFSSFFCVGKKRKILRKTNEQKKRKEKRKATRKRKLSPLSASAFWEQASEEN